MASRGRGRGHGDSITRTDDGIGGPTEPDEVGTDFKWTGSRGGQHLRVSSRSGNNNVMVMPHRHEGVFIVSGEVHALCTKNMIPGEAFYGEKLILVENDDGTQVEYREWNPYQSNLAAAILNGIHNIWIRPGSCVLYLGAASGITTSHISDIVGPEGLVYAIELSHRHGRDLVDMAQKRDNVVPIIKHPFRPRFFSMLVGAVDVLIAHVDHLYNGLANYVTLSAMDFLKVGGHYLISLKTNGSTSAVSSAEAVMEEYIQRSNRPQFRRIEQVTLDPFDNDRVFITGSYRMS